LVTVVTTLGHGSVEWVMAR